MTQWLDASSEIDEHVEAMIHLLNSAEGLQHHFEFTMALMNTKSDEEVPVLKEKFPFIKNKYPDVHSKNDLAEVPVKYAVVIIHEKIFLEFKKAATKCFKKHTNGEIKLVKKAETLAWMKIIVRISFSLMYLQCKDWAFRGSR